MIGGCLAEVRNFRHIYARRIGLFNEVNGEMGVGNIEIRTPEELEHGR